MIQEMLKESIPNPPLSTTTTLTSSKITNNNNNNNNDNNSESNSRQKLRCPRCESTNTKFCYYNNYNLTQPRHFCKSCRRYWTKGGTLRNVPIGGGCRKNKSSHNNNNNNNIITAKAKSVLSTEFFINGNNNNNNPGNFLGPGLLDPIPLHPDLQLSGPIPSPNIWASLALLRGATARLFPSPIPASNSNNFTTANSTLGLGLDPYGNGAPNQMVNGFGLLDPEQRIKSSSGNNYNYCGNENQGDVILGNVMTSSSDNVNVNSTVLEGIPNHMGGSGGYGIKNNFGISSWTEFPTVPN